jgi:hypothetical protein
LVTNAKTKKNSYETANFFSWICVRGQLRAHVSSQNQTKTNCENSVKPTAVMSSTEDWGMSGAGEWGSDDEDDNIPQFDNLKLDSHPAAEDFHQDPAQVDPNRNPSSHSASFSRLLSTIIYIAHHAEGLVNPKVRGQGY